MLLRGSKLYEVRLIKDEFIRKFVSVKVLKVYEEVYKCESV